MKTLFRAEALQNQSGNWLGELQFKQPLHVGVLTVFFGLLAALPLAFLTFAGYTKKASVTGQLVPSSGISTVVSPGNGTVTRVFRREGMHVRKGDRLALVSMPRGTMANVDTQAAIESQMRQRAASLESSFNANAKVLEQRRAALASQISSARQEFALVQAEVSTSIQQLRISEQRQARLRGLGSEQFVSALQLEQQESAMLDQLNQSRSLQRAAQVAQRSILQMQQSEQELSAQLAALRANRMGESARISQEIIENQLLQEAVVFSPTSGVITSQSVEPGQSFSTGQPLMSLLPDGAKLEAHLSVPSRSIGFIRQGATVLLRYQAYPSAKFGRYSGKVLRVSRSAISPQEAGPLRNPATSQEPYYRVVVELDRQSVLAYGNEEPLRPGMLLDADILLERRRLVEWLFEPLYAIRGHWMDR